MANGLKHIDIQFTNTWQEKKGKVYFWHFCPKIDDIKIVLLLKHDRRHYAMVFTGWIVLVSGPYTEWNVGIIPVTSPIDFCQDGNAVPQTPGLSKNGQTSVAHTSWTVSCYISLHSNLYYLSNIKNKQSETPQTWPTCQVQWLRLAEVKPGRQIWVSC